MQTILAIDDEESIRASYRLILGQDFQVLLAKDGREGLDTFDKKHVDLILLDLTMPGMSGEQVLSQLEEKGEDVPVVVVTASNSVTSAVDAMKLGARDYVIKPFDVDTLLFTIERILREEQERRELMVLREAGMNDFDSMMGSSPAFMEVLGRAKQAMNVDSTVLITGESGTGKDVMARAIHGGGKRGKNAYVPLSCCAIPAALVESELFGHERGAFTGAVERRIGKMQVADGGTIFLDEIGEMPLEAQAKLLRVLQDQCFYPLGSSKSIEVDARVICATNRDLRKAIEEGIFREDLYYRINVLHIELPPLRRRREDIPGLVAHFVAKHGPRVNATTQDFESKTIARLAAYPWPGNIRELENTIERLLVHFGQEKTIRPEHVRAILPDAPKEPDTPFSDFEGLPLDEATRKMERYLIRRALERSENVQSRAAEMLGTTRRILKYKMDQLNIDSL